MGLPRAIKAHQAGNLNEAAFHYKRALDQDPKNPAIYQNYGALLKKMAQNKQAKEIYSQGLKLFPGNTGIMRNYANLVREDCPIHSLEIYFQIIQILSGNDDFVQDKMFVQVCDDIIGLLFDNNLKAWCLSFINSWSKLSDKLSANAFKHLLMITEDNESLSENDKSRIFEISRRLVEQNSLFDSVSLDFALAFRKLIQRNFRDASSLYQSTIQRILNRGDQDSSMDDEYMRLVNCNSWNFSCASLPLGELDTGWRLFEYGLRTPADGPQRWQRAMPKPFSSSELPLWNGTCVPGIRLLVLEEQAVGDVMMFMSLLPRLLDHFGYVGVYISDRLKKIYERSFSSDICSSKLKFFSKKDLESGQLSHHDFDYQIPIGSICQYLFTSFTEFAPRVPVLTADNVLSTQLRQKYLSNSTKKDFLVGVSWRGGGRGPRVKQKSIDPNVFASLLSRHSAIRYIDLQYGDTAEQIKQWKKNGLDIISDNTIDPLKDMDSWLSQVQACDAVLSVANTTIHGAGGLNIPTLCLLSIHSDWRWLVDPDIKRSYWYPSVGIARQTKTDGWKNAFDDVHQWLSKSCPMPTGSTW